MPRVNGGSPGMPISRSGSASGDDQGPYSPSIGGRDAAGPVGEHGEVPQQQGRHGAAADHPDEPVAGDEAQHQRPPNAATASSMRASGRSFVMTTLTTSGSAAGQATIVWVRS